MFAFLFSKAMDPFYEIFLSFPTIIFSVLVVFCTLFCLVSLLGVIDFDFLNFDIPDIDGVDTALDTGADSLTNAHVLAGLMSRFGLIGIPAPIILCLMSLIGWILSFTSSFFLFKYIPGGILQFLLGVVILFVTLYVAAYLTGVCLLPFKGFFKAASQETQKDIVGSVAIIRTSKANAGFGEATVEDGGAGLIVKVRSYEEEFSRGDRVVLLEYVKEEHIYRIISEKEFNK